MVVVPDLEIVGELRAALGEVERRRLDLDSQRWRVQRAAPECAASEDVEVDAVAVTPDLLDREAGAGGDSSHVDEAEFLHVVAQHGWRLDARP